MKESQTSQSTSDSVFGRYLPLEERGVEGIPPENQVPCTRSPKVEQTEGGADGKRPSMDFSSSDECPGRNFLQEETDPTALREWVRTELRGELARHAVDNLPNNQWLVNELYRRLLGTELLEGDELLRFLLAAATGVSEEVAGRAIQQSTTSQAKGASPGFPTLALSEPDDRPTTFKLADAEPATVLARIDRWQVLSHDSQPEQQRLAELYALSDFGGRTPEELADLFDRPLLEMQSELNRVTAHICGHLSHLAEGVIPANLDQTRDSAKMPILFTHLIAYWRRNPWVLMGSALAGALLLAFLVYWTTRPQLTKQTNPGNEITKKIPNGNELVAAPEIEDVPAAVLGKNQKPNPRQLNLILPAIPIDACVAVLELGEGKPQLRTVTDSACPEVRANEKFQLKIPFLREPDRTTRVLVVWTERPCGPALDAGLNDGSIRSFAMADEGRLIREIAKVVNRSGNQVFRYRFKVISPQFQQKDR